MKRRISVIGLSLLLIFNLTACGSSAKTESFSNGTNMDIEMPMAPAEAPEFETSDSYYEESATGSVLADQKLIYTANLTLETTTFEEAVSALEKLTGSCGGYFENSTIGDRGSGYSWASYTIRVPAKQFQRFLDQAGEVAHLTWCNTNQENITEVYYDTQGRLETQKIKLERLQDLLRKADNMADIITLESAISETEWQIENLSGTMRHYDALVDFSTINVELNEVYRLSNTEIAPLTFGQRMSNALSEGLQNFGNGMEDLMVALAYSWLWLLLLAVVAMAAWQVVRKVRRKQKTVQISQNDQTENKE